jgi:hypothetical protein
MKVLNYIICSTIILIGIVLLFSGEILPAFLGILYVLFNLMLSGFDWYANMWKKFLKTNGEINKYFRLE